MATPMLTIVCWAFALLITALGLFSFIRGCIQIGRVIAAGQPAYHRTTPVWRRTWTLVSAILSHREFKGRPVIRVAHWFVMLSFPLLFLTLITGYAQIRHQNWQIPWLGHQLWWSWLTEIFAWGGLLAIVALMNVRTRAGRGTPEEAAGASPDKRKGTPQGPASQFLGSTRWQALFVEWVILLVCACVVVLRGLDWAFAHATGSPQVSWVDFPLTFWLGALLRGASPVTLANAIVVFSTVKIAVSMLWMVMVGIQPTMGVAWHRFLAIFNLYARRNPGGQKALGGANPLLIAGKPVHDSEHLADDARLGTSETADLTWKDRLDFFSCTECGRCQEVCPAWNTGKPLSPKLLILSLRDHVQSASVMDVSQREVVDGEIKGATTATELAADGGLLMDKELDFSPHSRDVLSALSASHATGPAGVLETEGPLVPGVIGSEVLWACTMCGACVDACPVDIEHIDHIMDLRRGQVLMAGSMPRELAKPMRGLQVKLNPYNQTARKRLDWVKRCPVPVPVIGQDVESAADVDYLFWVGSAGTFDDRARKTSSAVAELLTLAGVSFAVLGALESSSGDTARRIGDEVTFLNLAHQAIDTLHEAKATKILVTSPHILNVMANEYPQLGGHFEVVHHTQLLAQLIREGRLKTGKEAGKASNTAGRSDSDESSSETQTMTYHDPCFLGRHNGEFDAPRTILNSLPGVNLVEMPRNRALAMCCGAGGGRSWMEEKTGVRIADARMAEAAGTGASVVATACPFCSQMLGAATGSSLPAEAESDRQKSAEVPSISGSPVTLATPDVPINSLTPAAPTTPVPPDDKLGARPQPAAMPEVRDIALMLLDAVKQAATQN